LTVVGLLDFLAAMKSVGVCSIKLDTVGIGLAGPSPGRCGILEPQCRLRPRWHVARWKAWLARGRLWNLLRIGELSQNGIRYAPLAVVSAMMILRKRIVV
jgi:hypothetical protein